MCLCQLLLFSAAAPFGDFPVCFDKHIYKYYVRSRRCYGDVKVLFKKVEGGHDCAFRLLECLNPDPSATHGFCVSLCLELPVSKGDDDHTPL